VATYKKWESIWEKSKMDKNKCPNLIFPKKSWKKNAIFGFYYITKPLKEGGHSCANLWYIALKV
jgi:hypothetical protein